MKIDLNDIVIQARFEGAIGVLGNVLDMIIAAENTGECSSVSDIKYMISKLGVTVVNDEEEFTQSKQLPVLKNISIEVTDEDIETSFEEVVNAYKDIDIDSVVNTIEEELKLHVDGLSEEELKGE